MFFKGMNGPKTLKNNCSALKNNGIVTHSLFNVSDTEHRKVIWICEKDFHCYEFDDVPLNEYIDSLKVHAIFVGSSNFSFSTLFNAFKGEMDLLLLDSDSCKFKGFDLEGFIERNLNEYKNKSDIEELEMSTIVFRDLEYLDYF